MPKGQVKYKQRDIARTIRAVQSTGAEVGAIDHFPDRVRLIITKPGDAGDDLDKELASFVEAHTNEGRT